MRSGVGLSSAAEGVLPRTNGGLIRVRQLRRSCDERDTLRSSLLTHTPGRRKQSSLHSRRAARSLRTKRTLAPGTSGQQGSDYGRIVSTKSPFRTNLTYSTRPFGRAACLLSPGPITQPPQTIPRDSTTTAAYCRAATRATVQPQGTRRGTTSVVGMCGDPISSARRLAAGLPREWMTAARGRWSILMSASRAPRLRCRASVEVTARAVPSHRNGPGMHRTDGPVGLQQRRFSTARRSRCTDTVGDRYRDPARRRASGPQRDSGGRAPSPALPQIPDLLSPGPGRHLQGPLRGPAQGRPVPGGTLRAIPEPEDTGPGRALGGGGGSDACRPHRPAGKTSRYGRPEAYSTRFCSNASRASRSPDAASRTRELSSAVSASRKRPAPAYAAASVSRT